MYLSIIIIIAMSHKIKYSSHNFCIRIAKRKAFYLLKFAIFRKGKPCILMGKIQKFPENLLPHSVGLMTSTSFLEASVQCYRSTQNQNSKFDENRLGTSEGRV
jgi:hypothetical protein